MTSVSTDGSRLWLLRLHSATGVVPLAAFLALHLWVNAAATQGQVRYESVTGRALAVPGALAFEVLAVWLPLAFHAGYGVWLMTPNAPPRAPRPRDPAWARPLERITGIVTLAFLVVHLVLYRLPVLTGQLARSDLYRVLTDSLSTTNGLGVPVVAVLHLVGLASTAYHLSSGIMGFSSTFDLVRTEWRHRTARAVAVAVALSLFLLGARTIVYFATGASFPS